MNSPGRIVRRVVHFLDVGGMQNQTIVDGTMEHSWLGAISDGEHHVEFVVVVSGRDGRVTMKTNNELVELNEMNETGVPHVLTVNGALNTITAENRGAVFSDTRSRDKEPVANLMTRLDANVFLSILKKIDCSFAFFVPLLLMKEITNLSFRVFENEGLGVRMKFANRKIDLLIGGQKLGTNAFQQLARGSIVSNEAIDFGDGFGFVARKSILIEGEIVWTKMDFIGQLLTGRRRTHEPREYSMVGAGRTAAGGDTTSRRSGGTASRLTGTARTSRNLAGFTFVLVRALITMTTTFLGLPAAARFLGLFGGGLFDVEPTLALVLVGALLTIAATVFTGPALADFSLTLGSDASASGVTLLAFVLVLALITTAATTEGTPGTADFVNLFDLSGGGHCFLEVVCC